MQLKFYAFYSREQESLISMYQWKQKYNKTVTNYYKVQGTHLEVEVTEVCSFTNNSMNECIKIHKSRFSDSKYLGIVDKWLRVCKYI